MAPNRPHAITAASGRTFATFPAAVVVPIVNGREELLLLESQRRPGLWEPVNGAVEGDETLLEAALREVREEAGPDLRVRPLGVVHASTFAYDLRVPRMISVVYLMAHDGGAVVPGDDMRGSGVRWATFSAIESEALRLLAPLDQAWLRRRTVELFRLWNLQPAVELQGRPSASGQGASVKLTTPDDALPSRCGSCRTTPAGPSGFLRSVRPCRPQSPTGPWAASTMSGARLCRALKRSL